MTLATKSSTTFAIGRTGRRSRPSRSSSGSAFSLSKFYDWRKRYGKVNEHNGWIPRDWWLEDWEKQAIIEFHDKNPLEGYRRLTFMMLDADVVAASPSSVYRVLSEAGLMKRHNTKASLKGTGFQQPLASARALAR